MKTRSAVLIGLFAIVCALTLSSSAYAQDDLPPEEEDPGATVISTASDVLFNKIDSTCECTDEIAPYARCANKYFRKAVAAFKPAARFNQESGAELKSALKSVMDDLIAECEEFGSEDPIDDEDPPMDEE